MNAQIILDNRLIERYLGKRENQNFNLWPEEKQKEFRIHPEDFGAEPNQDFYERVKSFCESYENCKENILIVSHGGVYKNIYRYYNNITDFSINFPTPETCEMILIKE